MGHTPMKRFGEAQELSGATLLLANHPHGGENLRDLLVGQILWVSKAQLAAAGVAALAVLALWLGLGRHLGKLGFYVAFALSVTASVQLVGVYLVFASLIIPALAVRRQGRGALATGYAIGVLGYGAGLAGSALTDLPAGPVIVWTLAVFAIAWGLRPRMWAAA